MRYSDAYNWLGRGLHRLAFANPSLQRMLGELETDLFARRLGTVRSRREVFVTGLPRAGTTLLLQLLYGTGEFESFTYRHMPFVLMPMLWSRLSGADRRTAVATPRAHDDGMTMSIDSPEAFEEVVWLAYERDRIVRARHLEPLGAASREFVDGMRATIGKLLADSVSDNDNDNDSDRDSEPRYLSKNNANLSRLDVLSEVFPSCTIFIVFRNPAAHVASLLRQHRRFLKIHEDDAFARRYMKWIGHYEFGLDLRPINFSAWLDDADCIDGTQPDFWLRYWTEAYSHALKRRTDKVCFVDFDRLRETGAGYLAALARVAGLRKPERLTARAHTLRAPTCEPLCRQDFSGRAWDDASAIHARLRAAALSPDAADTRDAPDAAPAASGYEVATAGSAS
jgi:hypothetical protein